MQEQALLSPKPTILIVKRNLRKNGKERKKYGSEKRRNGKNSRRPLDRDGKNKRSRSLWRGRKRRNKLQRKRGGRKKLRNRDKQRKNQRRTESGGRAMMGTGNDGVPQGDDPNQDLNPIIVEVVGLVALAPLIAMEAEAVLQAALDPPKTAAAVVIIVPDRLIEVMAEVAAAAAVVVPLLIVVVTRPAVRLLRADHLLLVVHRPPRIQTDDDMAEDRDHHVQRSRRSQDRDGLYVSIYNLLVD